MAEARGYGQDPLLAGILIDGALAGARQARFRLPQGTPVSIQLVGYLQQHLAKYAEIWSRQRYREQPRQRLWWNKLVVIHGCLLAHLTSESAIACTRPALPACGGEGTSIFRKPVAYQSFDGARREIHDGVVLTRIARVQNETVDVPDLDF